MKSLQTRPLRVIDKHLFLKMVKAYYFKFESNKSLNIEITLDGFCVKKLRKAYQIWFT